MTITQYTDLSGGYEEEWSLFCGIAFDDLRVFASSLGSNVTPERVVREAVLTLVDDDHIDFPDTSDLVLEQVDLSDPTTVGQAIQDINGMLDWDWGFGEGRTFYYRKPWTKANVPPGELIVVSFADPNLIDWGVRRGFAECYNKVIAHYQKPSGRIASVTVSDSEGLLGAAWRTKYLDLTATCTTSADATTVANAYLADGLWPLPTGTIEIQDYVHLASGIDTPAIHVKPGMRIVNLDLGPDEGGRMLVTSVTGNLVSRRATLEVGTRSNRLDRILARRELEARRRRRKPGRR